ncbi:MAG: diguanylate cyclase [Clostridiales bacterium]|nr:diguanylate cyclase [Clostridiales bacterium]
MEIVCGGNTIRITASFGVSSFACINGNTIEDLIEAADSKMYLAKAKGRNRVEY